MTDSPGARRPRATPLPENIRSALSQHHAEAVAVKAEVSITTIYRAVRGGPVTRVVRAALMRVLGAESPKVAA